MSKSVKAIALVAGLAAAGYVGGTWYMGKVVESTMDSWYAQADGQLPYLKVVKRDYKRNLFGATDDVVLQLSKEYLQTMVGTENADMQKAIEDLDPTRLELHIHSDIRHGPLPGAAPAAGRVLTTVMHADPDVRAGLDRFLGGKPPLQLDTTIGFTGGGTTHASSPPIQYKEGETSVEWSGLTAVSDFSKDFDRYALDATMPGLSALFEGGTVQVTNIKAKGEQKRVFPDNSLLYSGTMHMSVDNIRIVPPAAKADEAENPFSVLAIDDVTYDTEIPLNGEFLDIIARFRANGIQVDEANYGPAHFDMTFAHLQARATAAFYEEYMKLYTEPGRLEAMQADPTLALASLAAPGGELLKHDPQLRFDRISFNTPAGETRVSLDVAPKGITLDELQNPIALMGKVSVNSELSVPMQFIASIMASSDQNLDADSAFAMVDMQTKQLIDAGYMTRTGDVLNTKLSFANGQFTANGKPLDPALLGM